MAHVFAIFTLWVPFSAFSTLGSDKPWTPVKTDWFFNYCTSLGARRKWYGPCVGCARAFLKCITCKMQSGLSLTSPEMFCRRCVIIVNADYLECVDKICMHKPVLHKMELLLDYRVLLFYQKGRKRQNWGFVSLTTEHLFERDWASKPISCPPRLVKTPPCARQAKGERKLYHRWFDTKCLLQYKIIIN